MPHGDLAEQIRFGAKKKVRFVTESIWLPVRASQIKNEFKIDVIEKTRSHGKKHSTEY